MLAMSKSLEKTTHNTLNLLEQLAADANLQTPIALTNAIEKAEISFETKALIKQQDIQVLSATLQLDHRISSVIVLPADDEDGEEEKPQEDSPEENKLAFA